MSMNLATVLLLVALPTTLPGQNVDCTSESLRNVNTTRHDDEYTRVKWESRNCKGSIEIRGTAKIAGDLSGFTSISPGGRITIETDSDDADRKLVLTPSNDRFAYQYEVDGNRRAWDAEGQRWLASVVALLVRRTGFGADERVDYLLREKGVGGVIDEVRAMDSDYTQRMYLNLMLNKTTLNGGAVRSVIDVGASELQSDYELTQLLLTVSKRYALNNESRDAFIRATRTIDSDYERRRALSAVLSKGSLSADDVAAVLSSTAEMDSDYERSQVLKQVSADWDFSDARLQQAYLKAAGDMSSDYERRQSLTALLNRGKLAPAAMDVVLEAAGSFRSDYERAQVLLLVLNTQTLNQSQKARMVKLIDEIHSDHERGKVASLMLKQMNLN
jgi:hypothetical protein